MQIKLVCSLFTEHIIFKTVQLIIAERRILWKKGVKQREKKCKVWPISIRCTRHLLPKKHSWIGSRMKISHFSKEFTFWLSSRRGAKVLLGQLGAAFFKARSFVRLFFHAEALLFFLNWHWLQFSPKMGNDELR